MYNIPSQPVIMNPHFSALVEQWSHKTDINSKEQVLENKKFQLEKDNKLLAKRVSYLESVIKSLENKLENTEKILRESRRSRNAFTRDI